MLKMVPRNNTLFNRREFVDHLVEHLGGENELLRSNSENRYYHSNRSNETSKKLSDYSREQLQEFIRLKSATNRAYIFLRDHSEAFYRRIPEILHEYMREQHWTWKNDLQRRENRAFECANVVLNRLLGGDYYSVYTLNSEELRLQWRNGLKFQLRFNLFEHERVGYNNRVIGRYRNGIFQWSKRGMIKYIRNLVVDTDNELNVSRRNISIDMDSLRDDLVNAETKLITARLNYEVFSKIDIEEHPKYQLACFLNVNKSDLLSIFAPNAMREAALKKKAIEEYMENLDPMRR